MRILTVGFILLTQFSYLVCVGQTITLTSPPNGNNQQSRVTQWIGLAEVTITYHGPDVHSPTGEDRKGHIWGELVHYGLKDTDGYGTSVASPWRAGSNEITTVSVSHDVKINGSELKAGTYGLYLLLDKDKPWVWIFSSNTTSWGGYYYKPNEDVLRVETTPQDCAYTEWLTYGFDNRDVLSAVAYLQWENKRIPFKIEVLNGIQLYVNKMRGELTSFAGFNYANWLKCARFCLSNKINVEEALTWVDISMNTERFNGQKSFAAMRVKSDLLLLLNREHEAQAVMTDAMTLDPTVVEVHDYGKSLLEAGKSEAALKIFKQNSQRHQKDMFMTKVGLARGFTAIGNKKEAIRNWEIAIKNIPVDQKGNLDSYQKELLKLK
ncbi:MAG: DUF2911 domain-containing protein [Chryseolinea sp.]